MPLNTKGSQTQQARIVKKELKLNENFSTF